ncbi:hypothetical protein [Actinoplanes philippinensis]|uniref:hypothetical protein n=1 Tax=Actinoplanes philippinensis TaxID=35752 RepID=UPI0033EEAD6D
MRLSPKTVFLALLVVGLPFAVVTGWALGAPAVTQATLGASGLGGPLGGDGALGSAPGAGNPGGPAAGGFTAGPPRATADPVHTKPAPTTGPSTVTATVTVTRTADPRFPVESTDPPLTNPPVPTPTQVSGEPDDPFGFPFDPSATPPFPFPPPLPSDQMGFERFRYWRR